MILECFWYVKRQACIKIHKFSAQLAKSIYNFTLMEYNSREIIYQEGIL